MRSFRPDRERGVALFIVLIVLLLVTALGMGMLLLSGTETNTDANFRDEQVALFAAKAGLEEARDRMLVGNPNPIPLPTILPGAGGGAYLYYITASGVTPWSNASTSLYPDKEYLAEMNLGSTFPGGSSWYASSNSISSYSNPSTNNPVPYQWVRVNLKIDRSAYTTNGPNYVDWNSANANDQVCYDTQNLYETVVAAGGCAYPLENVYEITSYAVTPSGTHRMLQQEVTIQPVNLTFPGALTIDGPLAANAPTVCGSGSTCNSGGAYITGNQAAGCTLPAVAGIATNSATSQTNLIAGINNGGNENDITGTGADPSVSNAASALANANLTTPAQIEALVAQIKGMTSAGGTNFACDVAHLPPVASGGGMGTAATPTVTVIYNDGVSNVGAGKGCPSNSDVQLNSGNTGAGILVVTGGIQYVNVNSYQGAILMLGTAQFTSTSSKDTTLTGALFMAKDRCASVGDTPGPCTQVGELMSGLGSPEFNYHHGSGKSTDPSIQFNQCMATQDEYLAIAGYRVLSQRELMF